MSGRRTALVVAVDTYEHEGLRRLRSPRADADALAAVLGDPQVGDFDVHVVHNRPAHEVQAHVEELFVEARPDDLLLLHMACHGVKNDAGELYLAATNTRLDRLASTAVPADFVQRGMRTSRARRIVLLLDCCYGGAFGRGVSVRAAGPVDVLERFRGDGLDGGRGRAVITASSAMEYAFEGDTLTDDSSAPTSVFTEVLVRGLATGEADRDGDGWVSLDELYDYVFDRVRTTTPGQTPTRDVQLQGELYLARSRRRRVAPAPLPPDLLAASHDTNAFTRLGAVAELRARLLGPHLAAAAGAHARLVEIAQHDLRHVADAAAAALAEAAPTVAPDVLDLGAVVRGSDPPHGRVALGGPPLARAVTCAASDARVVVVPEDDRLDVSVGTDDVGPVDAEVTVTAVPGEARVTVRAVVVPAADARRGRGRDAGRGADRGDVPPRASVARRETAPDAGWTGGPPSAPHATGASQRRAAWEPLLATAVGAPGALVGAGVAAIGATLPVQWGSTVAEVEPELFRYVLVTAALTAVLAVLVLVPRTRRPAAALLLGAAVAATWGPAALLGAWLRYLGPDGGAAGGFWVTLAGLVLLVGAGALAGVAALRPTGGGPVPLRPRVTGAGERATLVGAVAAGALVVRAADPARDAWHTLTTLSPAVLVVALPLSAALVRPRRAGSWVALGGALGAVPVLVAQALHDARVQETGAVSGPVGLVAFAVALAVLLVVGGVGVAAHRAAPRG